MAVLKIGYFHALRCPADMTSLLKKGVYREGGVYVGVCAAHTPHIYLFSRGILKPMSFVILRMG